MHYPCIKTSVIFAAQFLRRFTFVLNEDICRSKMNYVNVWTDEEETIPVITAVVGERVTLRCRTKIKRPIDWSRHRPDNEHDELICVAGQINNGLNSRFACSDYNLTIFSATRDDTREYICHENAGLGEQHRMHLNVIGKMSRIQLGASLIILSTIY